VATTDGGQLDGEETLVGSWAALLPRSPGSRLVRTRTGLAAVFPAWSPLNNAILQAPPTPEAASRIAAELTDLYADAGVGSWALWVPAPALDLDAPGPVATVEGMARDMSTLVMSLQLSDPLPAHPGVRRTTVEAANLAGDEPVPADALPGPDDASEVQGWVLVHEDRAVTGAWTFRRGSDVGVYAVGTAPGWRRRGLAHGLMLHVLGAARRDGARTASLQSTRMGRPLYSFLGFRPVGRYDEWVPAAETPMTDPMTEADGARAS